MVMKRKPTPEVLDVQPPTLQPAFIDTALVDDRRVALHSLMPYVGGLPWTLRTYYKSVLGEGNNVRDLDVEESAAAQNFEKIMNLDVKVRTALSPSFDQQKGTSSLTGSCLIFGFMIPNVGDYFVATVEQNDIGLFRVSAVERPTHRNGAVWEITYNIIGYESDASVAEQIKNLEVKSIETYHYNKERLVRGINPLLRSDEQATVIELDLSLVSLSKNYINTFWNPTTYTLTLPSMLDPTYEHGLVDFFLAITSSEDTPDVTRITQLSHCNDPFILQPSIWTALKERDANMLTYCNQRFGRVATKDFNNSVYFRELYFSAVQYVMYPWQPDQSVKMGQQNPKSASLDTIAAGTGFKGSQLAPEDNFFMRNGVETRLYPWILEDDFHVFREPFYKDEGDLTVIETETRKYLRREALDPEAIKELIRVYHKLNRLDQFYFGPILLLLIRVAIDERY